MDKAVLDSLRYFEGSDDTTMLEIRVWRATMYSLIEAHRSYSEQLLDAMKIMRDFLAEDVLCQMTSCCSKIAMDRLLDIVTRIASIHTQVWDKFCDNSGPYMKLMEWEDDCYDQLKKKSFDKWNKHLMLEKITESENKCYQKHLQKWLILHDSLSKMTEPKDLAFDSRFASLTGKVDIALTKYQSHFRREVKHRHVLAEQTAEIKHDFVNLEKERLGSLFDTLSDFLTTIEKIIPKSTDGLHELQFSPGDINTEELAVLGWESRLKSYTFHRYQGQDGTDPNDQSQPILTDGDFKLRKKPIPLSLFTAVAKDNFFTGDDINKQSSVVRSISEDTKTDILGPKNLLRKQSSTTTPAPVDMADNVDELDTIDPSGPNLMPLELDDDVSISDSLKNCGMVSEDEALKPKKKITFADMATNENKNPDGSVENGISSLGAPLCIVDGGSYDVLHKFWDPHDQHPTKPDNIKQEENSERHEYSINKSSDTKSDTISLREQPEAKSKKAIRSTATDKKQKASCANPNPAMSDVCKPGTSDKGPDKGEPSSQSDEPQTRHKLEEDSTSCLVKQKEKIVNTDILNSDVTDSGVHPPICQVSCLGQESEKNKKIDKKHSILSESSVEEIKMSKSFRIASRRNSTKKPTKTSASKQTAVESLTGPTGSEKNPVTVIVLKDRLKQNSNEISVRAGMKIKQTRGANEDGMAYGYKKTKFGLKKYGLYPSELVTLYNTRSDSLENPVKDA